MNKQEYNNVIEATVAQQTGKKDSLETTREMLNNMGVVLPQGDLKQVSEGLATDDYMGWRKCTVKEAQEYANEGTAVVAVSNDQIAVVAANEEEGEIAANSSAVMTLDENTSALAVADMAFYANSRAGTTVSSKEPVTIWYDEVDNYVKILFGRSGKIWHYIGQDLIFSDSVNSLYYDRARMNYFVDGDFGDVQDYSISEMKLLYAIDPYGFAYYIKRFAEQAIVDTSLAGILAYKDLIFKILFGRNPKYFARDINGEWYQTQDTDELDNVLSESEVYFGMHKLRDWVTWRHMIEFGIDIIAIVLGPVKLKETTIWAKLRQLYLTGVLFCSMGEAALKRELFSYIGNSVVESQIEEELALTRLDWIYAVVNAIGRINELVEDLDVDSNYCDKIINYCANLSEYNISVLTVGGQSISLQSLNNALN